jgi:hypothetical protein
VWRVEIASEDTSAYARLMARIGLRLVFAIVVPSAICQVPQPKLMSVPALPFYDWKACPFEGCSYRQWKARKQIAVYATWKQDRKPLTQLSKGDSVLGVTGVVITFRPGVIRLDRDLPEHNLKRGDTILTYAYRGEGYSAVWFKGRYDATLKDSAGRELDGIKGLPHQFTATSACSTRRQSGVQIRSPAVHQTGAAR